MELIMDEMQSTLILARIPDLHKGSDSEPVAGGPASRGRLLSQALSFKLLAGGTLALLVVAIVPFSFAKKEPLTVSQTAGDSLPTWHKVPPAAPADTTAVESSTAPQPVQNPIQASTAKQAAESALPASLTEAAKPPAVAVEPVAVCATTDDEPLTWDSFSRRFDAQRPSSGAATVAAAWSSMPKVPDPKTAGSKEESQASANQSMTLERRTGAQVYQADTRSGHRTSDAPVAYPETRNPWAHSTKHSSGPTDNRTRRPRPPRRRPCRRRANPWPPACRWAKAGFRSSLVCIAGVQVQFRSLVVQASRLLGQPGRLHHNSFSDTSTAAFWPPWSSRFERPDQWRRRSASGPKQLVAQVVVQASRLPEQPRRLHHKVAELILDSRQALLPSRRPCCRSHRQPKRRCFHSRRQSRKTSRRPHLRLRYRSCPCPASNRLLRPCCSRHGKWMNSLGRGRVGG